MGFGLSIQSVSHLIYPLSSPHVLPSPNPSNGGAPPRRPRDTRLNAPDAPAAIAGLKPRHPARCPAAALCPLLGIDGDFDSLKGMQRGFERTVHLAKERGVQMRRLQI